MSPYGAGIRHLFPALQRTRRGLPPVYLDNACMTLRPQAVIQAIHDHYSRHPACGGERSRHWFADEVMEGVQASRERLRRFLNARSEAEVIFTRNTTEALNLVARVLDLPRGSVILTTAFEHNSNFLPWKLIERSERARTRRCHVCHAPQGKEVRVEVLPCGEDNRFDLAAFEARLADERVRVVALPAAANLNGYRLPLGEAIAAARRVRGDSLIVVVDAAQAVPYRRFDVQGADDADFLAFSVHKMGGPALGVLYARREHLVSLGQFLVGGSTVVDKVYHDRDWVEDAPPRKFEAGLQDYAGIAASRSAVDFLDERIDGIYDHLLPLNRVLTEAVLELEEAGVARLIGPREPEARGSIVSLLAPRDWIDRVLAPALDAQNVMCRTGEFCVTSWFRWRGIDPRERAGVRFSFYVYNTLEEAERVAGILRTVTARTPATA
ncbi:MAG: aminotransferase class V-fold PLP-dependent enzyme [Planctomycetes bacterium]|nr:aminotransferase class V-fold PLP-dependent enzyme [Planctomycetota bacterium]